MIKIRNIIWFYLALLCHVAMAQSLPRFDIPFEMNGRQLAFPLAGGLNCPQLSAVDLNDDGILDLHVFDRVGNVQLTFLSDGARYHYAPEYVQYFPPVRDWMMLRDYNGDGILDIFANSDVVTLDGVMVYTGFYQNGHITFRRVTFNWFYDVLSIPLSSGNRTQLYVSRIDYPAIDDVDCDGDLDILSFNIAGGYVEFFANRSIERGFGRDSLIFELADRCWGGFFESGITEVVDLAAEFGACFRNIDEATVRHAGSTLLTLDINNNGRKDLILGDLSFDNLNLLYNAGTCQKAWMNAQDNDFPSNDVPVNLPTFPTPFFLDLTHDGNKDLAVAPNAPQISEDRSVIWLYENVGTNELPRFVLRRQNFLSEDMIDVGTGAHPVFVDYNADGLMDLVVGNYGMYRANGLPMSRLFLFENVGTATQPQFKLVDDDYLNMSVFSQNTYNFAPCFGDLDGDGDIDILVGEDLGRLFYAENIAGPGKPFVFGPWQYNYADIDVGIASTPWIADINRDGLPDLLIGERNGNINYFQNIGTPGNPQFQSNPAVLPNTERFGRIDARTPGLIAGYSAPVVLDLASEYHLVTGTELGRIEIYKDLEANIYEFATTITEQFGDVLEGARSRAAFADLDGDGRLEMVIGNMRGGLSAFKTELPADRSTAAPDLSASWQVQIFPNPAAAQLHVRVTEPALKRLQLFNSAGQLVAQEQWVGSDFNLIIKHLPPGVYIARVQAGSQSTTAKVLIIR